MSTSLAAAANRAAVLAAGQRPIKSHSSVGSDYIALSPNFFNGPAFGVAGIPLVDSIDAQVKVMVRSDPSQRTIWLVIDSYGGGTAASPLLLTGNFSVAFDSDPAAAYAATSATAQEVLEGWKAAIEAGYPNAIVTIEKTRLDRSLNDTLRVRNFDVISSLTAPAAAKLAIIREITSVEVDIYARTRQELSGAALPRDTPAVSALSSAWSLCEVLGEVDSRNRCVRRDYAGKRELWAHLRSPVVPENLGTPVTTGPGIYQIVNHVQVEVLQAGAPQ